ncbi:9983_t:CDS:2 [Funneliformis geosporum]|nr:9983_t:CDS:2 [Funneliformis geosporum]
MEVQRYLLAGTSLAVAKDKIKKAKKMVDIFEDDINFIKVKLPNPGMSYM